MTNTEVANALLALLSGAQKKSVSTGRKARKTKGRSRGRGKLSDAEKAAHMAKNDAEAVAKFTAAGYKDVQPRVNVLTYNRWLAAGRLVRKGEKSTSVGPFALFHVSQTDPVATGTAPVTADTPTANTVAA